MYFLPINRGQNNTKKKQMAFKECFGRLGELRSLLPGAPILALTATATNKIKKHVIESLSLKKDMVLIDVNPNRPNIYLSIKKITNDLSSSFQWLVDKPKKEMVPEFWSIARQLKIVVDCIHILNMNLEMMLTTHLVQNKFPAICLWACTTIQPFQSIKK